MKRSRGIQEEQVKDKIQGYRSKVEERSDYAPCLSVHEGTPETKIQLQRRYQLALLLEVQ